jgi:hypothetical protein
MDTRLRVFIQSTVSSALSSESLKNYPTLGAAQRLMPGLTQEAALLMTSILEQVFEQPLNQALAAQTSSMSDIEGRHRFIDPNTGLNLLMAPVASYRDRAHRNQSALDYLKSSEWETLTEHHLLYADHLRRADVSLHSALTYQALSRNQNYSDFFFELGICTREHLANPPKGYERQIQLMRILSSHLRAISMSDRVAREFECIRTQTR